ncbi:MAG: M24 family metallopeptidase, partial [Candidatus Bipolaricaulia bacterium]
DATDTLENARSVKTEYEHEKLRIANEIAALGLARFKEEVAPGKTEAQVAAAVEQEIRSNGAGYKGANFARASAEIRTGPGSYETLLFVPSRSERIMEGDIVLLELPTVVDGYWSDLTRVTVAGRPTEKQREVHSLVSRAQQAAIEEMTAGTKWGDVDKAARETIENGGYGDNFPHITGHGLGLRYHENIPLLYPGAEGELETGMVSSVEPGIYIEGWGGIRMEDNIFVTEEGPELLSKFDRTL